MLRFGAYTSRFTVAAGCCAVRLQSTNVGDAAPNVARRGGRYFVPTRQLPRFEIHDVRDEPAKGSMTRVSVDQKQLLVSQYPQLGPRKADPNDLTPQFDRERRISVRMRHMDLAGLVAVVEQRVPEHRMRNNAYDLTFTRSPTGYTLKGEVTRIGAQQKEEWAIQFEQQFAVTMEHFLESALTESFGFRQHQDAQQDRAARGANNNINNNNNNYNNNRRGRNDDGGNGAYNRNRRNNNNQRQQPQQQQQQDY